MTMVEALHGISELTYRIVFLCETQRKANSKRAAAQAVQRSIALKR